MIRYDLGVTRFLLGPWCEFSVWGGKPGSKKTTPYNGQLLLQGSRKLRSDSCAVSY